MLSQIRIYTINKGQMDAFLKHFKESIVGVHEKIGVPIIGTFVNRPQNEFIWIRTYKDEADREAKGKAFQAEIKDRCEEPPTAIELESIGAYRFLAD